MVDLFAGCGGLTLGIEQAATDAGFRLDVALAIDFEKSATSVYAANFPNANVLTDTVEAYFDGELGEALTPREMDVRRSFDQIDILIGGPPCQGHSNLNNRTRRNDPKNVLYARMGRAAEVLRPSFVVIENVPSVRRDTDQVVQKTVDHLQTLGYSVDSAVVSLHALGLAQTRRRHVLIASARSDASPQAILNYLTSRDISHGRNLRWAISDLVEVAEPRPYDREPQATPTNLDRMRYLLAHDKYELPPELRPACHQKVHSYKSMYGRLNWDEPAQTITSGFGSIGQGRYMHPEKLRALTAHEAARIQGFPDYFDFSAVTRRSDLATMIGNAVPPPLMREVSALLFPFLAGNGTEEGRQSEEANNVSQSDVLELV